MRTRLFAAAISILVFHITLEAHSAEIQVSSEKVLQLKSPPLDVALSPNGKWIYALTGEGDLLVYSGEGRYAGQVSVGKSAKEIRVGIREDVVLLVDSERSAIRVMSLDFIKEINTEGSPFKGPKDAPVVITEFTEFQCPHCAALAPILSEIHNKYPEHVKIVFKNYPLKNHPLAVTAAAAALAAERQGAFWRLHDRLFELQNSLSNEKIKEAARELGLDYEKLARDMRDPQVMKRIRQDIADAQHAGVLGVPAVFINGRQLRDRSLAGFVSMIEEEVRRAAATE